MISNETNFSVKSYLVSVIRFFFSTDEHEIQAQVSHVLAKNEGVNDTVMQISVKLLNEATRNKFVQLFNITPVAIKLCFAAKVNIYNALKMHTFYIVIY